MYSVVGGATVDVPQWVTPMFSMNFTCRKCEGNIGEAVEQEEKLCDEVENVKDFTFLGDSVNAGGG